MKKSLNINEILKWEFQNAKDQDVKDLVEFAKNEELYGNSIFSGKEKELPLICRNLNIIVTVIENSANWKSAKYGKILLAELENEPEFCRFINVYQYLLDNWDVVQRNSATYNLLASMTKLAKWHNDDERYLALVKLIKEKNKNL